MSKVYFDSYPNDYDSILIVQHLKEKIVFVRNRKRKWELTGGKKEPGESINETIIRESREESGAVIDPDSINIIGYYVLNNGHTTLISEAEVTSFNEIPESSEIIERKLVTTPLDKAILSFQDTVYDEVFSKIGWPKNSKY